MTATNPNRRRQVTKQWAFRLLAVALSVFVCFTCLEAGLRMWGPVFEPQLPAVPEETEDLGDGMVLVSGVYEYRSNPRGYFDVRRKEAGQVVYGVPIRGVAPPFRRVPESIEKREDILQFAARKDAILALGDSFTMGKGVRDEDTYVRKLERLLADDDKPLTITNAGVAGYDLGDVCIAYASRSPKQRFRLVLYGFVLNDFGLSGIAPPGGSDFIDVDEVQDGSWREYCASVNFVCESIGRIRLDRVTKRAYLEAFRGNDADRKFELLRNLHHTISYRGGEFVIVLFPLFYEFHDYPFQEIHERIRDFCRENEILVLDLLPAMTQHRAESLWVHSTDHHPNEIAHEIAAEEIFRFLGDRGLLETLVVDDSQQ